MAAAKIRVSDIAKKMGKSEKDVIFQLQSPGAEITDASQVLEPEVVQALITGKKLTMRTRSVIMREDKPQVAAKKEAVRPPRAIVKPAARPKREVPVVTGVARRGDMELYLNGLGSVTAFYTVTLRSRVDGELMKVHFSEGQMVHDGQLLAEIDPHPGA